MRIGGDAIVELNALRELIPRRAARERLAVALVLLGHDDAAEIILEGSPPMPTFTDLLGRAWPLRRITVALLKPLRELGIDLGKAGGLDALADPETCGRVMWLLCGPQADAVGVTPEQFAEGFDGPTIFAAMDAFTEALADFTQRPAVAEKVKAMLPGETQKQVAEMILRLETPAATRPPGTPSTSSPEPTPIPPASSTSGGTAGSSAASAASTPAT
jgi:hypothetical protein